MNPARTGRGGTAKARDIAQTEAVTPESAEPDVATPVAPQTPEVAAARAADARRPSRPIRGLKGGGFGLLS